MDPPQDLLNLLNKVVSEQPPEADDESDVLAELYVAIRLFDITRLEGVLASGVVLDVVYRGTTPLNYACRHREGLPLVKKLLEAGASVHFHDRRTGSYPLHKAIGAASQDLLLLLLDAGASASVADRLGQTPLHFAANVNGVEAAELLIQRGANVNARSSSGMTPLHVASKLGHADLARMFLAHGAAVDVKDARRKVTPLRNAVDHWCTDIVEMLLKHGADPNAQAYGSNPLLEAAHRGHLNIAKLLLAAGAKVECRHVQTEETPLIRAAGGGHLNVVTYLLENFNADVNAQDAEGHTPIIRAIEMNHKPVIDALIKHKSINLDIQNNHGWTALLCAINYTDHHCNEWSIRDLLEAGVNPGCRLANGQTCLHLAAHLNLIHAEPVAKLLLRHGANAEARDSAGETPLLQAAKRRNFAMAFLLLEVGVKVIVPEKQFLLSEEFVEHLMIGEGGNGAAAEALQRLDSSVESAVAELRDRISTPPSLLQLARQSTRQQVIKERGRSNVQRSILNIDCLPKSLRNYLLLI